MTAPLRKNVLSRPRGRQIYSDNAVPRGRSLFRGSREAIESRDDTDIGEAQHSDGIRPKFWIQFDSGDRYVAGIVERQFARAAWQKASTQEAADRCLVLVSAETDLAQIASGYQSGLVPVVIVTSNDVREGIPGALARHQWIDVRRRRLRRGSPAA